VAKIAMIVTNECSPDPRVERHARWLGESGHHVTIFAWDRSHSKDEKSQHEHYIIHRKRIGSNPSNSPLKIIYAKKKFLSSLEGNYDVVVFNDSDTLSKNNLQSKFEILDLHDLAHAWPLMQKNSFPRRILSYRMKKQLLRNKQRFQCIFTSSPGLRNHFDNEFGIESTVVLNRRDTQRLPPPMTKTLGYFGRIRDLDSMKLLMNSAKQGGFNVLLAGDGSCTNEVLQLFPEIDYRGPFDEGGLKTLMAEIDVMYAMYNPEKENIRRGALPVKMFDAAAFGRPSITTAGVPMGDFCLEEGMGVTAQFGNVQSVIEAFNEAYEMEISECKGEEIEKNIFLSCFETVLNSIARK
jgi:glycosyltransferase involved in cell wall biosynthesis